VTKSAFDQTPNLTETFDQVKRSSEIRSSECFPFASQLTFQQQQNFKSFFFPFNLLRQHKKKTYGTYYSQLFNLNKNYLLK